MPELLWGTCGHNMSNNTVLVLLMHRAAQGSKGSMPLRITSQQQTIEQIRRHMYQYIDMLQLGPAVTMLHAVMACHTC